jgi:septal ring factor EnvC (AmiA/AmiB activator)
MLVELEMVRRINQRIDRIEKHIAEIEKGISKIKSGIDMIEKVVDESTDKIAYLQGKIGTLTDRAAKAQQDILYLMMVTGELKNKT